MSKIICFIFGHYSVFKKGLDGHRYYYNGRECLRCKKPLSKSTH